MSTTPTSQLGTITRGVVAGAVGTLAMDLLVLPLPTEPRRGRLSLLGVLLVHRKLRGCGRPRAGGQASRAHRVAQGASRPLRGG
jgi:hypothetical protein